MKGLVGLLIVVAAATSCDMDFWAETPLGPCVGEPPDPCYPISIDPPEVRALIAESLAFRVMPGVSRGDDLRSTWSITGDAVRLLTPDGAPGSEGAPEVSFEAINVGKALVQATLVRDTSQSAQTTIIVGDSSVITTIRLSYFMGADPTLRAGGTAWIFGGLIDAHARPWRGSPAAWSSSDTNVATVSRELHPTGRYMGRVRMRSAGVARITATFRTVHGSIEVGVKP